MNDTYQDYETKRDGAALIMESLKARLRTDFGLYTLLQQSIVSSILAEFVSSEEESVTLTPNEVLDKAGRSARHFLNQLANKKPQP